MKRNLPLAAVTVALLVACTAQAGAAKEPAATEAPAVTALSTTPLTEASAVTAAPTDDELVAMLDTLWEQGSRETVCSAYNDSMAGGGNKDTVTNMILLGFLGGYGDHPGKAALFSHARELIQRDC